MDKECSTVVEIYVGISGISIRSFMEFSLHDNKKQCW